jgi:hypothetical protein
MRKGRLKGRFEMNCADCNYLIWSSTSRESAEDGLNRLSQQQMRHGRHKFIRFRQGADIWDVLKMSIKGQHQKDRSIMGKALSAPSLNGNEIMALALRANAFGQKAIAARLGLCHATLVGNWLKLHGLPTVSGDAAKRSNRDRSSRYDQQAKACALESLRFVAGTLGRVKRFYDWVHDVTFRRKVARDEFIGPKISSYRKDLESSRRYGREKARERYQVMKHCPFYMMKRRIRTRLSNALRLNGQIKHARTLELLGADVSIIRDHLESQFKTGMRWENMGKWHIDHVTPIAAFDITTKAGQMRAFHYTNLQPLWAWENLTKNSRLDHCGPAIRKRRAHGPGGTKNSSQTQLCISGN